MGDDMTAYVASLSAEVLAPKAAGSWDLTGERALVTGAKGRLGQIWVEALRRAGATVEETDTDAMLRGDSPFSNCEPLAADLEDPAAMERLRGKVWRLEPLTILVNNAGVDSRPTDRGDPSERMLAVNLRATDLLCRLCGDWMAQQGKGVIINIASLYGLVVPDLRYYDHRSDGWTKDAMYGATKAGIVQLTKYYAAKYGPSGVRVNALAPGGVVTDADSLTMADPEFARKYTARIPMGRMCRPEDLAGPLVFLASQASSFVNGQVLAVDGGYTCW